MVVIGTVSGVYTLEKAGKTYKTVGIEGFSLLATDIEPLPSKDTFIEAMVSNYWPKGKKSMFFLLLRAGLPGALWSDFNRATFLSVALVLGNGNSFRRNGRIHFQPRAARAPLSSTIAQRFH